MSYSYEEEKQFREIIEKLIVSSGTIDNISRLYEEIFGNTDEDNILSLAEDISVFFEDVENTYEHDLLEFDKDTFIYKLDEHYKKDLVNITEVIQDISADDFEKLCALFLEEIVKCENVSATKRSHDQGIDFVGYKNYVHCLTANEQNNNILYVIGQAKHYKNEQVKASEIRELAGSIHLLKTSTFSKKRNDMKDNVIYKNLEINAFTPIIPYFITSNYFTKYAYILCKNASIIAVDRLGLVLNLLFSNRFNGMDKNQILSEIQKVERIS